MKHDHSYVVAGRSIPGGGGDPILNRWMMTKTMLSKLIALAAVLMAAAPGSEPAAAQQAQPPIGLNLTGPSYWSSEYPFRNLAYLSSRWRAQPQGKPFSWDDPLPPMSADGYPLSLPAEMRLESLTLYTPNRNFLAPRLAVTYAGKGRIDYSGQVKVLERTPGRDLIARPADGQSASLWITATNPQDPLRDITLKEVTDEQGTFRKAFLNRLAGMRVLRFMDWMNTNNSPVKRWEERPVPSNYTFTEGGVPIEMMVELANTTQAAPWFTIPHLADDDYVRNFAQMVKSSLKPELPVYVEYSNEVWNGIFKQAAYAADQGARLRLSSDRFEGQLRYYSQRTTEVIKIWKDVFGADAKRVVGVYATQYANPWTSSTVLNWKDAKAHAGALAIAPYFGNILGDPQRQAEVSAWTLDQVFEALSREIDESSSILGAQAQIAKSAGVQLVAYEAGQHLVGYNGSENNTRLEKLFLAANRDRRMGDMYKRHFKVWAAAGGSHYVYFSSMSTPGKWGNWGLLEYEGQKPAEAPKWLAVRDLLGLPIPQSEQK